MNSTTTYLLLTKPSGERFVFVYDVADNASRTACLRTLGRFASNPELSFSWYDAAMLSQKVRQAAIDWREECEMCGNVNVRIVS